MMLSDVCLSDVCRVHPVCGQCVRPAGWYVLADRARFGRPGSRLPLPTSVADQGGGVIPWWPPAYSLFVIKLMFVKQCFARFDAGHCNGKIGNISSP